MRITALAVLMFLFTTGFTPHSHANDKVVEKPGFLEPMKRAQRYLTGRSSSQSSYPYLRPAKYSRDNHPRDDWSPAAWVDAEGSITNVIDGFYDAGVIVDQHEDRGLTLVVGEPFMMLSPLDQYRVAMFVDYAFKVTEKDGRLDCEISLQGESCARQR